MLRMGKDTKLTSEKVIEKAKAFFGSDGLGLEISGETTNCCITFEGGGGYVTIELSEKEKGASVEIIGREWDYQIKDFIGKL